jgi:hypothetical protein
MNTPTEVRPDTGFVVEPGVYDVLALFTLIEPGRVELARWSVQLSFWSPGTLTHGVLREFVPR